jgi:hypothetical protein
MVRQRMKCNAPPFSPADYDYIMQCAEKSPRTEVLKGLTDKYHTSQKRIYQIWRGEEKNRVAWNQPIHMPTASLSNINVVGRQTEPEIQGQDVSPFTELEKEIRDVKIEPSKSIDSVLEEGGKTKKTGTKKSKSKSALAELIPSPIQTQPTPIPHEKIVENNIKTLTNVRNILEK